MTDAADPIEVKRSSIRIRPDPRRTIAELFVPGQEGAIPGESRAGSVIDRVLDLSDEQVRVTLSEVVELFEGRHRDLRAIFADHFAMVAHRIAPETKLSIDQRALIGAYFTRESAVEAAAICNPSMVAHPDQGGLSPGETRFVMAVRAIGEGHRSSIEFRTGVVGAGGDPLIDEPAFPLRSGVIGDSLHRRESLRRLLGAPVDNKSSIAFVLERLPDVYSTDQLDDALGALGAQLVTRRHAQSTIEGIRRIAAADYSLVFDTASPLSARVLSPVSADESNGMEDARFVRFTGDDGNVVYYATYTGYDGSQITSRLLRTVDFSSFSSTQLTGRAASSKGMALFPRLIDGHYVALSRWDRTTNSLVRSLDPTVWDDPVSLQRPGRPWDLIQLGNCGSPIETPAGWLALTHGVGPMRRYVIGADLLDLDDPSRVVASLVEPLMVPASDERDGYVPNVVYSCGAMLHAGRIVIPYGIGDANIGVVTLSLDQLLTRLVP